MNTHQNQRGGWKRWSLWAMAAALLVGCATLTPMALDEKTQSVALQDDSIVLLHLHVVNEYKPNYQPDVTSIFVINQDNQQKLSFQPKLWSKRDLPTGHEYLVSLRMPTGHYELNAASGISTGFMIFGSFQVPLHKQITVPSGKVVYMGRIDARNVERTADDQERAGAVIPLLDQAVTGYSGGTFKVDVSDRFEEDMQLFKHAYPALRGIKIEKVSVQG